MLSYNTERFMLSYITPPTTAACIACMIEVKP